MGRGRRHRNMNKNKKSEGGSSDGYKNDLYDTIVKENALFEKYYRQLNIIEENEFELFLETLKKPLPITFRITSYKSFATELLKILREKHFKYIDEITKGDESEKVIEASANKGASLLKEVDKDDIYKCLSWYPNELAWQVNLSRQDVRKNVHFEEFKKFLIQQTENGNLSRQEAVSMIPPLLLDVKPNHKILDMCASPGSKTAQLIEFLHQDSKNIVPEGFVIANDLENKRCYMLMHQLKRLQSPNFMIINHDASSMPNFRTEDNSNLLYDRILADVPCSGDGTFRKNIDVWKKWNFAHACNLHGIQFRIAKRAVELLEDNGMMVYSTCSMNPVENEAVVYNLLLKFKGQLELVDARDKLPGLKTQHGLLKWNLMDKNGEIYDRVDQVKPEFIYLIRPHMFPPELEVAKQLNLDRCVRVLPHYQNTGGFFIAVLRKTGKVCTIPPEIGVGKESENNLSTSPVSEETINADASIQKEEAPRKEMKAPPAKRLKHVFEENPFQFIDLNNQLISDWPKIKSFYDISDEFPMEQMMTRNKQGENIRSVYFVSKQIRELTINNGDRMKFINMGVPLFSRSEIKDKTMIELRVCQESIDIALKYFNRRIVYISSFNDLAKILTESMPSLNQLSEDLQNQIKEQSQSQLGSLIFTTKSNNKQDEMFEMLNRPNYHLAISFTAWLGKTSLRPFLNIHARNFFLNVCGFEKSKIDEVCEKIRQEDKMNSHKSLLKNPHYKPEQAENDAVDDAEIDDDADSIGAKEEIDHELIEDEN